LEEVHSLKSTIKEQQLQLQQQAQLCGTRHSQAQMMMQNGMNGNMFMGTGSNFMMKQQPGGQMGFVPVMASMNGAGFEGYMNPFMFQQQQQQQQNPMYFFNGQPGMMFPGGAMPGMPAMKPTPGQGNASPISQKSGLKGETFSKQTSSSKLIPELSFKEKAGNNEFAHGMMTKAKKETSSADQLQTLDQVLNYLNTSGNHIDKLDDRGILHIIDVLVSGFVSQEFVEQEHTIIQWLNRIFELDFVKIPNDVSSKLKQAIGEALSDEDRMQDITFQLLLQRILKYLP
jgi:hypothetical protein